MLLMLQEGVKPAVMMKVILQAAKLVVMWLCETEAWH